MNKLPPNHSATYIPFNRNFAIEGKDRDWHAERGPSTRDAHDDILDAAKGPAVQIPDRAAIRRMQRSLGEPIYADASDGIGLKRFLYQLLQSLFERLGESRRTIGMSNDENEPANGKYASNSLENGAAPHFSIWDYVLAYMLGDAAKQRSDGAGTGLPDTGNNAGGPNAALTADAPPGPSTVELTKPESTGKVSLSATQPPNSLSVRDFGAKGDGVSDDQAAIQRAFDAAKASGQSVWLPPGTYNHNGVLTANGIQVSGAGEGTVLRATNPDQGALKLTGNNGAVSNLTVELNSGHRSSMPDAAAICVQGATNATVSHVKTVGAASNGIRLDNALNSRITNNLVMGSNADGIALMNGSCFNTVENNVVYQAGDDAFSDNSYIGDHRQDEGNIFRNNLALDNKYGRGFALMGSKNATVENSYSNGTPGHGIAAGTDYNSDTMVGTGHVIRNNMFLGARATPIAADGMTLAGNQLDGAAPSLSAILGWTPSMLLDRNAYNPAYVPGTGPGANNTPGNRT